MAEELNADTFTKNVKNNDGFAVIDFFAEWCGPCKAFAPTFDEVAKEMADKLTFGKVNVDLNREIAEEFGVMSIPTMIVFKGGKEVKREMGKLSKESFIELLNNAMQ